MDRTLHPFVRNRLAVDVELRHLELHTVSRQADDALHEDRTRLVRQHQHREIAAPWIVIAVVATLSPDSIAGQDRRGHPVRGYRVETREQGGRLGAAAALIGECPYRERG